MEQLWTQASVQTKDLAKAVAYVFACSNLTVEDRNPPRIEINDLSWQAPPLLCGAELQGIPMQCYLDGPIPLDETKLHSFWMKTLHQMAEAPHQLMLRGTHRNCSWAMPKVKTEQRSLRFSQPEGWPGQMPDYAGLVFSLEVAHAARISAPLKKFVSDDDNYYAVLTNGDTIGVKNGKLACHSPWDFEAPGLVQMYLQLGRGEIITEPQYDQLSALRSVLHSHAESFPNDFEAMDLALQTLRYMVPSGFCPELHTEMKMVAVNLTAVKANERDLREAIELMAEPHMNDRSKLQALMNILVPGVMSLSAFRRQVSTAPNFPFTAAPGKMEKITEWLHEEYASRVPDDLKQLKED